MPNINLIAARREEKKRLERTTRQLFFGVAGSLGVLVTLSLFLGAQRLESAGELREIEARLQKLQPVLDEIKQVKSESADLAPKVETLREAKAGTQKWRAILQVVSQSIPERTWLSSMSASGAGDDTTINITGVSGSQALVGETMTRLGVHPLFDKVELSFTQAVPSAGGDLAADNNPFIQFQINCHLRGAPEADAKKDGEKSGDAAKTALRAGKEDGDA